MNIPISSIQRDTSIQTRAEINMETVNSYADKMTDGVVFDPVTLYGTADECWIGDGWHRIMAAEQIGALDIPATLKDGTSEDALWYAMGANKAHGLPMKRGDVKRAVELAVKTWPNKSQQEIAEQVGCSQRFVGMVKEDIRSTSIIPPTRTDSMGRTRPTSYATRKPTTPEEEEAMYFEKEEKEGRPADIGSEKQKPIKRGRPCNGMQFARMALLDLDQIEENDSERERALAEVKKWMALNAPDDPGKAMRVAWKAAGKSDRESFMEWTAGRGSDLPKGNYRKMQSVLESLKRLLRSTPNIRNDAATELREILEKLEAQS